MRMTFPKGYTPSSSSDNTKTGKIDSEAASLTNDNKSLQSPSHGQDIKKEKRLNFIIQRAEHFLTVVAFLGGITFAGMILVMQTKGSFEYPPIGWLFYYPELLIIGLASICFLFIMATLHLLSLTRLTEADIGGPKENESWNLCLVYMLPSIFILGSFIPLLLLPFTLIGSIFLAGLVSISFFIFFKYIWKYY
jgi:hypothetical protein